MPYIHQSESWARSLFPPAPVINGVQILPLSIGHLALLDMTDVFSRLQNVMTAGGALVQGVTICSQLVEKTIEQINLGSFDAEVEEVGKHIFEGDVNQAVNAFAEYLSDSQDSPAYFSKSKGGKSGSDFWMSVKTLLQERLHLSDYEMLNRPVTQCLAEYFSIAEMEGWLTLQSASDASLSERAKQDAEWALEIAKKARSSNA